MPDFITEQDVVDYLGRGGTADAGIVTAVAAACQTCRTITEQTFTQGTSTITLDGTGTDALLLPERPVSAAGTVLVSGGTVTDYALKDNGVLIRKYPDPIPIDWWTEDQPPTVVWPEGRQNVEVTYDHGYEDVPEDVQMVALSLASRLIVQGVAVAESQGQQSVRYGGPATDLTNGEKAILRKYRQ